MIYTSLGEKKKLEWDFAEMSLKPIQKWHFGCPNENTFIYIQPTSPKNDGIAFDLKFFL